MKKTVLLVAAFILSSLLAVNASAVFTESIERKDGPEQVSGDTLIITPISELSKEDAQLHEDIKNSLKGAKDELGKDNWKEFVEDFAQEWKEKTGGAPENHAIVSDIFDVRYPEELTDENASGKEISFGITLQGLTSDDLFMIIYKPDGEKVWRNAQYSIGENNVITIDAMSKSSFAVVRDNGAEPEVSEKDSPQTGVSDYNIIALLGIIFFGITLVFCTRKLIWHRSF